MIANSMGFGPGALFDLASLEPAISGPLAALQRETLSRLAVPNGRVIRLTFSKDKLFRPDNDKVLVEIRVAGDGPDHQWIDYDLSGNVAATDNMVNVRDPGRSPGFAPRRGGLHPLVRARDRHRRLHPPDRERSVHRPRSRDIPLRPRDRSQEQKDFDQALSDYSEAIRLDPNYAHAYLNRGVMLADKRELDRAIVDFAAAIRLDPTEKLGL